jgi:hypothetical protein
MQSRAKHSNRQCHGGRRQTLEQLYSDETPFVAVAVSVAVGIRIRKLVNHDCDTTRSCCNRQNLRRKLLALARSLAKTQAKAKAKAQVPGKLLRAHLTQIDEMQIIIIGECQQQVLVPVARKANELSARKITEVRLVRPLPFLIAISFCLSFKVKSLLQIAVNVQKLCSLKMLFAL